MAFPNPPAYFRYWGKTRRPPVENLPDWHLLVYHCLDVAACGYQMAAANRFGLRDKLSSCGLEGSSALNWIAWLFAAHDIGKFARGFQRFASFPGSPLVPLLPGINAFCRHDSLGMYLWRELCNVWTMGDNQIIAGVEEPARDEYALALQIWMSLSTGHHGLPPDESSRKAAEAFCRTDVEAARAFLEDLNALFPLSLPEQWREDNKDGLKILRQQSWLFAGVMTLCDWIGSDQAMFPLQDTPMPLADYWPLALEKAQRALGNIPLPSTLNPYSGHQALFPFIDDLTPLQQQAAALDISAPGPQLIVMEDVTGAGKTEAALILAHRLLSAGKGKGLYVGLPGMATANAMYQRLQKAYRQLFSPDAAPSLMLAHSTREMSDAFRHSIWQPMAQAAERYASDEATATSQCHAWYADSRKKALLAEIGVGTLDQLLMAVMPFRHQPLRLLGMQDKVLLLDEVHAYDGYMIRLLEGMLHFHAAQGGSAIILSATLPASLREKLLAAFSRGVGYAPQVPQKDDYPLLSHLSAAGLDERALATRPEVKRSAQVSWLTAPEQALALIEQAAASGQCICWIRNTVDEALDSYRQLAQSGAIPQDDMLLFHSRFAFTDRMAIEDKTLSWFGKDTPAAARRGKVLIATQVVEQSLDLDFDVMISDLAPIDLLIQRAGRLQRHIRDADGRFTGRGTDVRPSPVLYVLAPEWRDDVQADHYARALGGTRFVYPDHGALWRTQSLLREAGAIRMPEGARALVDGVYEQTAAAPEGLQTVSDVAYARTLAVRSVASQNLLDRNAGFSRLASDFLWDEEREFSTRLGEESLDVYLAWRDADGELQPLAGDGDFRWERSRVSLRRSWWEKRQSTFTQPDELQLAQFCKQQHRPGARVVLVSETGEAEYYSRRFGLVGEVI